MTKIDSPLRGNGEMKIKRIEAGKIASPKAARLDRDIKRIVAKSMADMKPGTLNQLHYLAKKRAELLGKVPKKRRVKTQRG